jgi:hypothetical protein
LVPEFVSITVYNPTANFRSCTLCIVPIIPPLETEHSFALNEVIKRFANMDDNLLILDEPTDGFSKEQMYQLNYVFDGLNTSQVIIVSHEKELEGFVECTCRVIKDGGLFKGREILI